MVISPNISLLLHTSQACYSCVRKRMHIYHVGSDDKELLVALIIIWITTSDSVPR